MLCHLPAFQRSCRTQTPWALNLEPQGWESRLHLDTGSNGGQWRQWKPDNKTSFIIFRHLHVAIVMPFSCGSEFQVFPWGHHHGHAWQHHHRLANQVQYDSDWFCMFSKVECTATHHRMKHECSMNAARKPAEHFFCVTSTGGACEHSVFVGSHFRSIVFKSLKSSRMPFFAHNLSYGFDMVLLWLQYGLDIDGKSGQHVKFW